MSDGDGKFSLGWFRSGPPARPVDPSRLRAALAWARSLRGVPYDNGITVTPEPRLQGPHLLVARRVCGCIVIHCPNEPDAVYLPGDRCTADHHSEPERSIANRVSRGEVSISGAFRANQAATEKARRIAHYLADDKPMDPFDPPCSNETPASVGSSPARSNDISNAAVRAGAEVIRRWRKDFAREPDADEIHILDVQMAREVLDAAAAAAPSQETVHMIADGEAVTSCCGRTPFELPRTERITVDPALLNCRPAVCGEQPWNSDVPVHGCIREPGHAPFHRDAAGREFVSRATIAEADQLAEDDACRGEGRGTGR